MAVVYKITRIDDLSYIGIAECFKTRLGSHKRSRRFAMGIKNSQILFEGSWDECDALESKFIMDHNTYKQGLNLTPEGKGKTPSCKFNTYGFKFSVASKQKMSASAKKRGKPACCGWNKGKKTPGRAYPDRQGSANPRAKLSKETVKEIIDLYKTRPDMGDTGSVSGNGRSVSYEHLFAETVAPKYSISTTLIRLLIKRKIWKHVWAEYEV